MPDNDDLDLDDQDESSDIRKLRAKAKRADAAEARAENAERLVALLETGLKLTPIQRKALFASHEGEPTPEGYAATAKELGFTAGPAEVEEPKGATAEEQAALGAMQEATAAAEASEATKVTVDDLIANAKDEKELLAVLANAGMTVNGEQ